MNEQKASQKILFVCTGNTCRSPMAEALARHLLAELAPERNDINFASAGVAAYPGAGATPQAVAVLKEQGIDISGHRAAQVHPDLVREASLILTMTVAHRDKLRRLVPGSADKIFTLAEYSQTDGDIPDPYGGDEATYRQVGVRLKLTILTALSRYMNNDN